MKNLITTIALITLLFNIGNSQSFEWDETLTPGMSQESKKMAADEKGNIFLVGDYADSKTNKLTNVFVAKYNLDKELIWVKLIGNDKNSKIQSITLDENGSPIVTGFFTGTLNLNNRGSYVLTSDKEKKSGFVIKLNALGDTEWAQSFLTNDVNYHIDLMVNKNQDITVFGLNNSPGLSGTMNVSGSALFSGSSLHPSANPGGHSEGWTLKTIGTTVMSGTVNPNSRYREMHALEVSGTANFHGNQYITGNLYVSDIIVAQEFHTEFVSASITFSSGSTKMGDTNDHTHQITGSVRVSGSGPHYFMGRQSAAGVAEGCSAMAKAEFKECLCVLVLG